MAENKSILHELYVFSEWKPEPEYLQKPDGILPENISAFWRWLKFFGPKKSLIDSVTAHKEKQQKWHIALGDEGKVIAVLTDNILEIRTKRSEYATIAARTTVSRDPYAQWRKLVWSPDCSFLVLAYGNGVVSFFDLTASNLFNIPADCSKPGGLECTNNTHAVSDIIFMPLRVKDTKWNWEVLVVTYDGRLRGYVVSQTEGCKLRHSFRFPAGVAALAYCQPHDALYVAGVPRGVKDPSSPLSAGITAWRILNDDPFYKLSVVSDQLEAKFANERFQLYIPFVTPKSLNFIVRMELSADNTKLVCVHCNGDVTVWRLPLLKLLKRWPLASQPEFDLRNPLVAADKPHKDLSLYYPADVNWWTNEEIIVSRFSGAVSVCDIEDMVNILGKKPEFFQGTPRVTRAHDGVFMALECESSVLPAMKSRSDESMEVVKVEEEVEDSMLDLTKELFKTILFAITDMETFQPKPKKITVVSRIYRLLGVKSTTPNELFSRKIDSGNYTEALSLAATFGLDSDQVYQQQWRKNPVSTEAIEKYLSKVSKKIWAVHQCVDRLPESLSAAKELLQFGLQLTNERILDDINKDKNEDDMLEPDYIGLEDLNSYTSELLRCRHVMLFYKERLSLYESILKCEKSTYNKDQYDRLRSNSIFNSAVEIAKEGRLEALTCLWPHLKTVPMQLAVLEKLPETIDPLDFQHLLPTKIPLEMFEHKSPVKVEPLQIEHDWCRKEIFRPIWSSNWSEDLTPEAEAADAAFVDYGPWYERRAREIEERCGLVSHSLALIKLATEGGGVDGLDNILFHLTTLGTLLYDINMEGVTLQEVEKMTPLETCTLLMKLSAPEDYVADLRQFVVPFLKRYERLTNDIQTCLNGLINYLESTSINDLSSILLVLQSPNEFELDVRTHLELAERCLIAHTTTDQLDMACDLLNTILKESDGSISNSELIRRVGALERLVGGASRASWRGVLVTICELRDMMGDERAAQRLLARLARSLPQGDEKPSHSDWDNLLKDILELQSSLFNDCVTKEQCYEIYASALLASGDAASIRYAAAVLSCARAHVKPPPALDYQRSVELILDVSKEYFNSASCLTEPALDLAKSCLSLIEDENEEIQQELDLITALPLFSSFKLTIIPIQVRLCENRLSLIEQCLTLNQNAYLAGDKLLKLAKLLRIAGDDDARREGLVLHLVGQQALNADPPGFAVAVDVSHRLAALRYAPAADLLSAVAARAHAHADINARRALLAASAAYTEPALLEDVLGARLYLEMECLQQAAGLTFRDPNKFLSHWTSAEDDFADAVTTPTIEQKDLMVPVQKPPAFDVLVNTFQEKFNFNDGEESQTSTERAVHCQEFYRCLYPEHSVCGSQFGYDRFSVRAGPGGVGRALLSWYYTHALLEDANILQLEYDVLQKCVEEIIYKDTPLSVACLLRLTQDCSESRRSALAQLSSAAVSAILYAVLLKCNSPELRDNVYLAEPREMARRTLQQNNATEEQMAVVRACVQRLALARDVAILREFGINVNALLFGADSDYRREIIYRMAESTDEAQVQAACTMARRHSLDELDVWLTHAAHAKPTERALNALPVNQRDAHRRVKEALWPLTAGSEHSDLISVLTLLKRLDERVQLYGLPAADHIKLLKRAKAASPDLDYKLLLEPPSAEEFTDHILNVISSENLGMVTKFLRSLPPTFKLPIPVNSLYMLWLTKLFFSVSDNTTNKKWMQQYRQCASYFSKLSKDDLLRFIERTCFGKEAITRVPQGTRSLMIMQAVDYCTQEEEQEIKSTKNEQQQWSQVGQELTRWARFLDNFHSSTVQAIIDSSEIPRDQIWPDLEMSHGEPERAATAAGRLVMQGLRPSALNSLLHCLNVDLPTQRIFETILQNNVHDLDDIQAVLSRVYQYHKEGAELSEELVEAALQRAGELELPPHRQLPLLSLSRRAPRTDLSQLVRSTADLLREEWPDHQYAQLLTDDMLLTDDGRREVFCKFLELSDTWQKKKALLNVLNSWPAVKANDTPTLQCEYLRSVLNSTTDLSEALVLIKLLLREPMLIEEEVKVLCDNTPPQSVLNAIWIVLLNKCEHSKDLILHLVQQHKESMKKLEVEDDLITELLDNDLFIPLVQTPLYSNIVGYIVRKESTNSEHPYNASWATEELNKANYIAEAGQLVLLLIGVPTPLRMFTESVLYFKEILDQ
ncbi:NBAS subunit of NRZ tethering complex-like isoform X2 [Battus philenor]|uniref:NBAS subunit of NRZ tethering complex-like isoform X2 n=1 Tax=Battus philenor TaxID=42288 RepID=UPI0035CF569C